MQTAYSFASGDYFMPTMIAIGLLVMFAGWWFQRPK
jgi:hypothetical protein